MTATRIKYLTDEARSAAEWDFTPARGHGTAEYKVPAAGLPAFFARRGVSLALGLHDGAALHYTDGDREFAGVLHVVR